MQTLLIAQPHDVKRRLAELGLSLGVVRSALINGFVGRTNCTAHDPIQTPGTEAWRHVIRGLRDGLIKTGSYWRKADPLNLPLIVNDNLEICITAESGDNCTGVAHLEPKQKNPKGSMTAAAVKVTAAQYNLFGEQLNENEAPSVMPPYPLWILLINIGEELVRAELSLLARMEGGKAAFWIERIILPEIRPDLALTDDQAEVEDVPIEISVERRKS